MMRALHEAAVATSWENASLWSTSCTNIPEFRRPEEAALQSACGSSDSTGQFANKLLVHTYTDTKHILVKIAGVCLEL